ncbi:hypothetical protein GQ607_006213 [Colletotrichum asianum]|uniref:Uncharacterized protein n=1 Tax=Colletotrichum asianum TaxID=702518 RepID=A0A8H3WHW6_9PEZI|nr:hypothetical protein GQ607_006213 [Colletotrichum asianum]
MLASGWKCMSCAGASVLCGFLCMEAYIYAALWEMMLGDDIAGQVSATTFTTKVQRASLRWQDS